MNLSNGSNTGIGLGLDHNEPWNRNYMSLQSKKSPNPDLRIHVNHSQFTTRTSSRMSPSPITDRVPTTNAHIALPHANHGHLNSLYHIALPQRSASEHQYRTNSEPPYKGSPARPSEASRLRAIGANASPLATSSVGECRSTSEEYRPYPPENFSRPRRKNSAQSFIDGRGGGSPRLPGPGLSSSNTFPLALPQSQTNHVISDPLPFLPRERGASNSSSIASSYVALPLRPSHSIPDYGMAESVHSSQRNIKSPQILAYASVQCNVDARKRDPPRSMPEGDGELRTSFRSALTTASSANDTTGTERSSILTNASSKTSVFGHEGMSVDDALDMYANGFQDSGQSDDEHNPRSSSSHPKKSAETRIAKTRLVHESCPAAQPHPLQSESIGTNSPQTIVRDSHAIFSQHLNPDNTADEQRERDVIILPSMNASSFSSLSKASKPVDSPASSGRPAIGRNLPAQMPPAWDGSRDIYGFKKENQYVTRETYDKWNVNYSMHLERRRKKWFQLMLEAGLPFENPVLFPPKSTKVKRYVRKGIPHQWRGAAWFHYGGGPALLGKNPGLYDNLLRRAETTALKAECNEQIERDLHRTFPDNIRFKPDAVDFSKPESPRVSTTAIQAMPPTETAIIRSLRRVLRAFSIYSPKIGYCQSLNFIAGLLLLFISDEEKAFWMLVIITHIYLPGTHEVSLEGANVDLGVLMTCVQDTIPRVWEKIGGELDGSDFRKEKHSMRLPPITLCCTSWFMSCFVGSLPIETTLRVWDSFFYEGSKTMFRIALAIFKHGEAEIRAVKDGMEIFQTVQTIPRKIIDANNLLEACFRKRNGFGHLSQMTIEKRRQEQRDGYANERAINNGGEVLVRKGTLFGRRRGKPLRSSEKDSGRSKEV